MRPTLLSGDDVLDDGDSSLLRSLCDLRPEEGTTSGTTSGISLSCLDGVMDERVFLLDLVTIESEVSGFESVSCCTGRGVGVARVLRVDLVGVFGAVTSVTDSSALGTLVGVTDVRVFLVDLVGVLAGSDSSGMTSCCLGSGVIEDRVFLVDLVGVTALAFSCEGKSFCLDMGVVVEDLVDLRVAFV